MKRNGNTERRRRENQGAEGWGLGEVSPSPVWEGSGEGAVSPPQKFFCLAMVHFGAFWALVLMLVAYKACKTESKSSFVCQLPIGQLSHMRTYHP